jgi:hypothetical protein
LLSIVNHTLPLASLTKSSNSDNGISITWISSALSKESKSETFLQLYQMKQSKSSVVNPEEVGVLPIYKSLSGIYPVSSNISLLTVSSIGSLSSSLNHAGLSIQNLP